MTDQSVRGARVINRLYRILYTRQEVFYQDITLKGLTGCIVSVRLGIAVLWE